MNINKFKIIYYLVFASCSMPSNIPSPSDHHPAEEFMKAVDKGDISSYSFRKSANKSNTKNNDVENIDSYRTEDNFQGDSKFLNDGLSLKRSYSAPKTIPEPNEIMMGGGAESARGQLAGPGSSPSPSFQLASYRQASPGGNPSLWMDSSQNVFLFNDLRAFGPMDIVTIAINDQTLGMKRANTQTRSQFDLLAGITNFFGLETKEWAANNTALNPSALVQAGTEKEFRGVGDMQRQAQLQGQISGVVLEVLPNGVLRIEGSKIVAINAEEEIMVISGLIRQRDISADNKIDSNRVANMRIDFYGHGTLSDAQAPGWAASLFNKIWPF